MLGHFGMIPQHKLTPINHDSSGGDQWGPYDLPRLLELPSGKHTQKLWKITFSMGKSTISTGPCPLFSLELHISHRNGGQC